MERMICKTAKDANDYVRGWLTRQPELKEESITDWLLDYFDQHSNQIKYYQFNRQEEGKYSGADWDWWFLLKNGCFKMRIQAKKVKSNSDHYTELARSNKNGFQIDLLLKSSSLQNFYPLYAFYAKSEGVEKCQNKSTTAYLHISSAQEVYELVFGRPRQRINSTDILELTIPLECLFCCPLVRDFNDEGPVRLFEHYFKVPPKNIGNDNEEGDTNKNRGFEEKTPDIITSLYNIETLNDNTIRLINEYRNQYPGSNSLMIIKIDEEIDIK
jgi:hypothetical protein